MTSYRLNNLAITTGKRGAVRFTKTSVPTRCGKYAEVRTPDHEFQFNLNGEIKSVRGLHVHWPHPSERLKRTDGNDWVYYSVSAGPDIISWLGEYYLPCLPYPSNSILNFDPYSHPGVMGAFAAWSMLYGSMHEMRRNGAPSDIKDFLRLVSESDESALHARAETLRDIIGGRPTVLPPDARHVDYEVIPLMIADGCLYHCKFCSVQSDRRFRSRSRENILEQIRRLKEFYGRDLSNYNALFLGNHDALGAGEERIGMAVSEAFRSLGFEHSAGKRPFLFLFGSVDSLLKAENTLFEKLEQSPFYTYINIGLESCDAPTLASIHKPLKTSAIRNAFQKMLDLNNEYANIEVTANFLLGEALSPEHNQSVTELLQEAPAPHRRKGAVYLSPLLDRRKRDALLPTFYEIKRKSRLPTFIYLIQRL